MDREIELTLGPGGVTFGRDPSNDLLLEDPERVVSSQHGRIDLRDGGVWLTDTSRNGTYLNQAHDPVPPHQPVALYDGDQLIVGPYEIQVRFGRAQSLATDLGPDARPDLFSEDLIGALDSGANRDILDLIGGEVSDVGSSATDPRGALIDDIFADASALDERLTGPAAEASGSSSPPRHTPVEHVFYRPSDYQSSNSGSPNSGPPESDPAAPAPPSVPESYDLLTDSWTLPDGDGLGTGAGADRASPDLDPLAGTDLLPEMSRQPDVGPGASGLDTPHSEPFVDVPKPILPSPVRRPEPPRPKPIQAPLQAPGGDLDAFLSGLGAGTPSEVSDSRGFFRLVGALVRELVSGLTQTMMTRARFKSELRLGVTTIRPSENNPFKFSSGTDDVLGRLLFRPVPGFLAPEPAAREAFEDIQAHEMAMTAGLQAALHALLARLDPAELEKALDRDSPLSRVLPMSRKARCWERFLEVHAQVSADASEDVMRLFGDIFAQAYQEQVRNLRELRSSVSSERERSDSAP